jgi:hypothetical protein
VERGGKDDEEEEGSGDEAGGGRREAMKRVLRDARAAWREGKGVAGVEVREWGYEGSKEGVEG